MRAGEFANGARVLRAKIDMSSPNINLRDPILYRIVHASHPRTGDAWSIYPTYDFAHGQSDAIEGVTHSLCTLEFEAHRPLYDWLIDSLPVPSRPRQIEFARLNLSHTVLSKRFLLKLVTEGRVRGWDDPRMPTISALRRRGFPAEGVRDFATGVGVAKADNIIEIGQLEYAVRNVLNRTAPRRFGVLDPIKVVIDNYPEGQTETVSVPNNPEDPSSRQSRGGVFARAVDRARRLHGRAARPSSFASRPDARCGSAARTSSRVSRSSRTPMATVAELRCTYDPATRGGDAPDGRRPKATLHWLSAAHAVPAEVRLYDHLFSTPTPGAGGDLMADLNPDSEKVLTNAFVERVTRGRRGGHDLPVRAARLLRSRHRHCPRPACLQPHADAQGHLGEGPVAGRVVD